MRKLISSALVVPALAIAAVALAATNAIAQQPTLSLEQLMSPQERAATGIAKLTPAERAALEAWLARYTATVSAVARGLGPGAAVPAAPAGPPAATPVEPAVPPGEMRSPFAAPPALPRTAPVGAHVFKASDGGTFVMLRDGTVWEIVYADRPSTTVWQAGDFVTVERSRVRIGEFDYRLVNATRDRAVRARFAGFVRVEDPAGRN